jgi:alpha-methylacyl-CoA racemase
MHAIYQGMMMADYGAHVILVSRPEEEGYSSLNFLSRNKRSLIVDFHDINAVKSLIYPIIKDIDVVLDPFRPSALKKFGLDYETLSKINPRLIYVSINGYGSDDNTAGHDLNYIAKTGVLSFLGKHGSPPSFPVNLLADFAGGGLMAVCATFMALYERTRTNKGCYISCSMTHGALYLSSFLFEMAANGMSSNPRGFNLLDGGAHFYNVYETCDKQYMAVACIESKFYKTFITRLKPFLNELQFENLQNQMDVDKWEYFKIMMADVFRKKSRIEWEDVFHNADCCVSPVVSVGEAVKDRTMFWSDGMPKPIRFRKDQVLFNNKYIKSKL